MVKIKPTKCVNQLIYDYFNLIKNLKFKSDLCNYLKYLERKFYYLY